MLLIDLGPIVLHVVRTNLGTIGVWRNRFGVSIVIVEAGEA